MTNSPPPNSAARPEDFPVGIVGLGLLGRGIAACLLGHGLRVVAFARRAERHFAARREIARAIDDLVAHAGFDPSLRTAWPRNYQETQSFADLGPCQFVVESVAEDLATKRDVLARIETAVSSSASLASNTSALPIAALQQGRRHPERILGMHWAEPAYATRFLEIVGGPQTSPAALAAAERLGRRVGKDPAVVRRDVPGFVVNRLAYAVYREALHLLAAGVADAETIDRAFRNACGLWSPLCGPLRWIDLTGGPALYARAMRTVLPDLCRDATLPPLLEQLAAEDAQGIANGRGFYRYTPAEAQAWEEKLRAQAWAARAMMHRNDPLAEPTPVQEECDAAGD